MASRYKWAPDYGVAVEARIGYRHPHPFPILPCSYIGKKVNTEITRRRITLCILVIRYAYTFS